MARDRDRSGSRDDAPPIEEADVAVPAPERSGARVRRIAGSGLANRILVAIPAATIAIVLIGIGGIPFAVALLLLGGYAIHEFYSLVFQVRPLRLAGLLILAGLIGAAYWGSQFHILLALAAAFPLAFLVSLFVERGEHATLGLAATIFGAFWIAIPVAHLILLRQLDHGGAVIIDVLIGTFIGDTFAYGGGKLFGRHKLAPSLSPNKTREGLVAGIIGGTFAVWFAGLYQDWITGPNALLLGFAVTLAAPLGDLFESMIKRDLDVKDTGKLFGAHGGALDRVDAALFTVVVGYYVWFGMAS